MGMKDMLSSTGEIIETYLTSNGFTVSDLMKNVNASPRTVARILKNEAKLTIDVASGVHSLIEEISIDFLMAYDAVYQTKKVLAEKEYGFKDIDECISKYKMEKLFKAKRKDKILLGKIAKNIFGINNINNDYSIDNSDLCFRYSLANGADDRATSIWLKVAYNECLKTNGTPLIFQRKIFEEEYKKLKIYSAATTIDSTIFNMKHFCKICGINFYYRPSIPKSRIKAVCVRDSDGFVYIFMSDLFKCIEFLWISFTHECTHILESDFDCNLDKNDDLTEQECRIDTASFKYFVNGDMNEKRIYSIEEICDVAEKNQSPFNIVVQIARLQSGIYDDYQINKYLHRFKYDDSFLSPLIKDNQ